MIKLILLLTTLLLASPSFAQDAADGAGRDIAQTKKTKKKKKSTGGSAKSSTSSSSAAKRPSGGGGGGESVIGRIKSLASAGQYEEASKLLFTVSRNPKNSSEAAQLKYMLGLMLMELKMNQVASFVFYDVIDEETRGRSDGKYLRQSLGKLSYLANVLDSDVLLKYAVSRIKVNEFPAESRDLFFYRFGEMKLKEGDFAEAAKILSKVDQSSGVYPQALYKQGLAYAEDGKLGKAVAAYEEFANINQGRPVTDPNKVNANLAPARVYYQAKKWDTATNFYRLVPRDTLQWHDALFEMSWAMMRSGQFRSASSNFHTLHSPYYEDQYAPEGLLLRAIVYLYICRYDEMEKVLDLFDKIYKPVLSNINKMLSRSDDSRLYWDEIKRAMDIEKENKEKKIFKRLDDIVISSLMKQPLIKSNLNYYQALEEEEKLMKKLGTGWQQSAMGRFSQRIIDRRQASTRDLVGKLARNHLLKMKSELRDFFEQGDFLKYEMVSGKKETVGKEIAGKKIPRKQITDDASRNFFITNGFEYWPFQGEYWLDELGNYHYVGVQACE